MKEKLAKLSKRELVLLVILILIVGYYFGVQLPVSKMSEPVQAQLSEAQAELDTANAKLANKAKMEKELVSFQSVGTTASRTPSYDNTNDIIVELNSILGGASKYTVSFGDTETDGTIVRRPIELEFGAATYNEAVKKIRKLESSTNGYLVTEATVTGTNPTSTTVNSDGSTSTVELGSYGVTVKMTSFEYKEK